MGVYNGSEPWEESIGTEVSAEKKLKGYIVAAIVAVAVLAAFIVSTVLCVRFYNRSRTLADELARTEQRMVELGEHLPG
ncbi:MAG: hypothetical protein K2N78_10310, partial [Oscillospiraceae bacterium]|nr:hypothetical protein [Oscillospiraceae bacterium]